MEGEHRPKQPLIPETKRGGGIIPIVNNNREEQKTKNNRRHLFEVFLAAARRGWAVIGPPIFSPSLSLTHILFLARPSLLIQTPH